jgi:hypothetical protein
MPLLSICDLVKIYQTDECMFDRPKREVSAVGGVTLAIAPDETAGLGPQILIYGLLIRPGIHLGFGTIRSG